MNREEVERLSVDLSNRFERMMTQMSVSNTNDLYQIPVQI